jgi:hypothetical protein
VLYLPSRVASALRAILAVALVAACAPAPTGVPHNLIISNQTSILVAVAVNSALVWAVQPRTQETILVKDLPAQPWRVEARTSGGRVLSSMTVQPGDVWERGNEIKGDAVRVDLSCGRLDIWSGPPLLGPSPGPGTPGDCNP